MVSLTQEVAQPETPVGVFAKVAKVLQTPLSTHYERRFELKTICKTEIELEKLS
jgi:ribosomal protein S8E